jgi:dipeptidyl aminopeptidase
MASNAEEAQPLTKHYDDEDGDDPRNSLDTDSTASIVLEHLNGIANRPPGLRKHDLDIPYSDGTDDTLLPGRSKREPFDDIEDGGGPAFVNMQPVDRKARRMIWIIGILCFTGWLLAAVQFVVKGNYKHASTRPHDPAATMSRGSGKKITMDQVLGGAWRATRHGITWINGPEDQDGLLLQTGDSQDGYLVVDDVRNRDKQVVADTKRILMLKAQFEFNGRYVFPSESHPSPNLRHVLIVSDKQSNWRHSYTGLYWLFDVNTQKAEPLDPKHPHDRIQLASWSPNSDAVVFTRNNNLYLRKLDDKKTVVQITRDGGTELFYGVPDWVYEEEVFGGNSATWWSSDGRYLAFLRTNESSVPTYPLQYFVSRPSGKRPVAGEESYPEERRIKYPKAGASNPVVHLQFYDISKSTIFDLDVQNDFTDEDRLITEVVWAGTDGKVLIRETNRESDILKVVLMDAERRTGRTIREENVMALDGGWFEVSEETTFIPGDPGNGRMHDGYVDTIIHEGYDHLAYFTPLDNPEPIVLTSGKWEVVKAPSAVDLKNNWVYFVATKESSIQRHIYRVKLDGTGFEAITDVSKDGYYSASFSKGGGYALLNYEGPDIPSQKVISIPGAAAPYENTIEENSLLKALAAQHELPILIYSTVVIDGFELNVLERRPPHFNPKRKYPVMFHQYSGPNSQTVDKKFSVDFQSYVAATLGYIVVTIDGRGTGFLGRKTRCIIRGNIGYWESHDQIEAAKMWAAKPYVDPSRIAIWGWSYGGFMALKTLERDAGRTFKYGMAVAPVTDWRFYGRLLGISCMWTVSNNLIF